MFFPIRTDRRQRARPWVNYTLIAMNVAIFIATTGQITQASMAMRMQAPIELLVRQFPVLHYYLWPENPQLWQFITYQFLHGDWMHLLGNMIFLYVFGNALEDRLGRAGYLAFYLAGGIFAGLGHAAVESAPVIGASGSIAAVTGAYLVLFPLVNVTIFYWFYFYIGTFEVSSLVLIGFQIAQNILMHMLGGVGVAYLAHLSGYGYGILIGMALLWVRLLPREPYDLLSLLAHRRRRAQFRSMTMRGYHPWEGYAPSRGPIDRAAPDPQQQQIMQMRASIYDALNNHDLDTAAGYYTQLLELDPRQVLSQQHQLDVANHLMAMQRYGPAARAYELFLNTYGNYPQREQIELILALVYARYLRQASRARELLSNALPRLHDPEQRALAQAVMAEVG